MREGQLRRVKNAFWKWLVTSAGSRELESSSAMRNSLNNSNDFIKKVRFWSRFAIHWLWQLIKTFRSRMVHGTFFRADASDPLMSTKLVNYRTIASKCHVCTHCWSESSPSELYCQVCIFTSFFYLFFSLTVMSSAEPAGREKCHNAFRHSWAAR